MAFEEIIIPLKGQNLAAKVWRQGEIPTLALHGWLDNAASFDRLAPLLKQCHLVSLDLPGHGLSDHQPPGVVLNMLDFTTTAIKVADYFGWNKFALLGHSLGGAICTLIAGALPSRILWAVLCDGLGPITAPAEHAPMQYRLFMNELLAKPHKRSPEYDSKEKALQARLKANPMQSDSIQILIERGLKQLPKGTWAWRTDPRLLLPLAQYLTEGQVIAYLKEIIAPVCVIKPNPGFPFLQETFENRLNNIARAQLFNIPGNHHVHLDSPNAVAECINHFLVNLPR
ncbi:MAG: alpha/beta hydrolase [Proteobacteria bacterium]|nr:alpha/beta hydrolase [Pseudomonadota bacterium]